MSSALQINGKTLHPIKEAIEVVSYSRDYVTRLAREEKIVASLVGRQWFVDIDSLKSYTETSAMEQDLRKKLLSQQRKQEMQIREATEKQNASYLKKEKAAHLGAAFVASLVLGFGLLGGWAADFLISPQNNNSPVHASNVAQVTAAQVPVVQAKEVTQPQVEPATLSPFFSNHEVKNLDGIENGILLLPQATSSDVGDLFSDSVVVKESLSGERVVVQVDGNGNEFGNEIPFVEIPVKQETN